MSPFSAGVAVAGMCEVQENWNRLFIVRRVLGRAVCVLTVRLRLKFFSRMMKWGENYPTRLQTHTVYSIFPFDIVMCERILGISLTQRQNPKILWLRVCVYVTKICIQCIHCIIYACILFHGSHNFHEGHALFGKCLRASDAKCLDMADDNVRYALNALQTLALPTVQTKNRYTIYFYKINVFG